MTDNTDIKEENKRLLGEFAGLFLRKDLQDTEPNFYSIPCKASVDDIVMASLRGKLKVSNAPYDFKFRYSFLKSDGDLLVDYSNPITKAVVDKINSIDSVVKTTYNVKVFEDHLSELAKFTKNASKEFLVLAYLCSGIGILHIIGANVIGEMKSNKKSKLQDVKEAKGLLSTTYIYKGVRKTVKGIGYVSSHIPKAGLVACSAVALGVVYLGKGIYDKILTPVGYTLNPMTVPKRYKAYIISHEKKKEAKKSESEQRKIKKKTPFFASIKDYCEEIITDSVIYDVYYYFFGYGMKHLDIHYSMTKDELQRIVHTSGAGQAYLAITELIEKYSDIVASATDIKPLPMKVGNDTISSCYMYDTDCGLEVIGKKQKKKIMLELLLNIKNIHELISYFDANKRNTAEVQSLSVGEYDAGCAYKILNSVIHAYTHSSYGWYLTSGSVHLDFHKDSAFINTNSDIRRQVIDYLQQNNINLVKLFRETNEKYSSDDSLFYIIPEGIERLHSMTRKRLSAEAYNLNDLRTTLENKSQNAFVVQRDYFLGLK